MIEKRTPSQTIVISRPLSPCTRAWLKAPELGERVVQVFLCPRGIHSFHDTVVIPKQLPVGPVCATAVGADLSIVDNPIGVRLEWDIITKVVASEVFGTDLILA